MIDKGIPRTGYTVYDIDGNEIGEVTSGTQSPLTGKSIGLAIIDRDAFEMGKEIIIQIRKDKQKQKL